MRKIALISLGTILLFAGLLTFFWNRGSRKIVGSIHELHPRRSELPAAPAIALQINRENQLTVLKGTPLILTVSVANPRAINAAASNATNIALAQEIDGDIGIGKIQRQSVQEELESLRQQLPIPVVRLGDAHTSWKDYVQFSVRKADGNQVVLPWSVRLVEQAGSSSLFLGSSETAQVEYLVSPSVAEQIAAGDYRVVARLESPAGKDLEAGTWRGLVESEPTALSVIAGPPTMSKDLENFYLQFARYYQDAKDWEQAIESAQKALSSNPKSISAEIIMGEVKQAQGDSKGALAAFQASLASFNAQHPTSYEPPLYILDRIASLQEEQSK